MLVQAREQAAQAEKDALASSVQTLTAQRGADAAQMATLEHNLAQAQVSCELEGTLSWPERGIPACLDFISLLV